MGKEIASGMDKHKTNSLLPKRICTTNVRVNVHALHVHDVSYIYIYMTYHDQMNWYHQKVILKGYSVAVLHSTISNTFSLF